MLRSYRDIFSIAVALKVFYSSTCGNDCKKKVENSLNEEGVASYKVQCYVFRFDTNIKHHDSSEPFSLTPIILPNNPIVNFIFLLIKGQSGTLRREKGTFGCRLLLKVSPMNGFVDHRLDEAAFGEKKGLTGGLSTFDAFRKLNPIRSPSQPNHISYGITASLLFRGCSSREARYKRYAVKPRFLLMEFII